jgi:ABC-type lipoprotein release transport system permease subunit
MDSNNSQNQHIENQSFSEFNKDTYSYRGWIVSDKFYKRAIAIWLYSLVAQMLFAFILVIALIAIGSSLPI